MAARKPGPSFDGAWCHDTYSKCDCTTRSNKADSNESSPLEGVPVVPPLCDCDCDRGPDRDTSTMDHNAASCGTS